MIDFKHIKWSLTDRAPLKNNDLREFCLWVFQHINAHCYFLSIFLLNFIIIGI
jgi:hypothetical protein